MSNELCFYSKQDTQSEESSLNDEVQETGIKCCKESQLDNYEEDAIAHFINDSPMKNKKINSHKRQQAIINLEGEEEGEVKEFQEDLQMNNYIDPIAQLKKFAARIPINTDMFAKKQETNQKRIICDLEEMNQITEEPNHPIVEEQTLLENYQLGSINKGIQQNRNGHQDHSQIDNQHQPTSKPAFRQFRMFQKSFAPKNSKQAIEHPTIQQQDSSKMSAYKCNNPEALQNFLQQQPLSRNTEFSKPKLSLPVNSYPYSQFHGGKHSPFLDQTEQNSHPYKKFGTDLSQSYTPNLNNFTPKLNSNQQSDMIFNKQSTEKLNFNLYSRSPNNKLPSQLVPIKKDHIQFSKASPTNRNSTLEESQLQQSLSSFAQASHQRRIVQKKGPVQLNIQISRPQMANLQRNKLQSVLQKADAQEKGGPKQSQFVIRNRSMIKKKFTDEESTFEKGQRSGRRTVLSQNSNDDFVN